MSSKQKSQIRNQLFTTINNLGLQDELKKHLRLQLIQKLQQKDLIKKQQPHQQKLYSRIMASIISQQLQLQDCHYSNSLFVAESGYDAKILTRAEVIQILGINSEDFDEKYSLVGNLLRKKYPFQGVAVRTMAVQTSLQEIGYTLEQRLALIDQEYRRNAGANVGARDEVEYKKRLAEIEQEWKRNYERDVERFKEFQSHAIKVKVSQEWRKKFEDYAQTLNDDYRRKFDALRKKQRALEENLITRNKVLDEKVNNSHKTFLNKIDVLDIKSSTVEQTKRNLEIQRKRMKQQFNSRQKQLKDKIRQHQSLILNMKQKIEYQVGLAKLSLQQEYQEKNSEFLDRKKFIDEQYGKLMGIKDTTQVIKQENKRLFEENLRLRKDLTQLEQQLRIALSESSNKLERLDSLRGQLATLQREMNLKQDALKQQVRKSKRKDEEIIQLRKQLDQLREWKQKNMQQSLDIDEDDNGPRKLPASIVNSAQSGIASKMQQLRRQRMKQIEKLKLGL